MVKTLCVGNVYCGKTSVIRRYVRSVFDDNYSTTVGVDFMLKSINVEGTEIKVQMWDIGKSTLLSLLRLCLSHCLCLSLYIYLCSTYTSPFTSLPSPLPILFPL